MGIIAVKWTLARERADIKQIRFVGIPQPAHFAARSPVAEQILSRTLKRQAHPLHMRIVGGLKSSLAPMQPAWFAGEQSIAAYYNATPATVDKLRGNAPWPWSQRHPRPAPMLRSVFADVSRACDDIWVIPPCGLWIVHGDTYVHGAFVSSTGELFSETTNWSS
jgi:hypothetical protein